ncbi:hypothetical protein VE25_01045 [Devosia geojensis]|uniref:Uncharacterized protein n=1 Tax=Devosia geojensis TaxID=443610 RepID=A0A0F5FXR7_9HYPH|nr:hypothetical protein [Devosia geojensis]KKB13613.1 hypothetical protein VE25_01045 [Devosia geojensis]
MRDLAIVLAIGASLTTPALAGPFKPWPVQHQQMPAAAELDMVYVQNTLSQRQMALQMTTNLMNSMNEATKTIIGNMGGSGSSGDDD